MSHSAMSLTGIDSNSETHAAQNGFNTTIQANSFAFPSNNIASSNNNNNGLPTSPPLIPAGHARSHSHSSLFMNSSNFNNQNNSNVHSNLPFSSFNAFNSNVPSNHNPSSATANLPFFAPDRNSQSPVLDQGNVNTNNNNNNNNNLRSSLIYSSPPLDGISENISAEMQATPVAADFASMGHHRTQSFLHAETTSDQFPILVRRESLPLSKQQLFQQSQTNDDPFLAFGQDLHQPFQAQNFNIPQAQNLAQTQQQNNIQQQQFPFSQSQIHKKHQSFGGFATVPYVSSPSPSPSSTPSNPNSSTSSLSTQIRQNQPTPVLQQSFLPEISRQHRHSQSFSVPHSSFTQPNRRSSHRPSLSLSLNNNASTSDIFVSPSSPSEVSHPSLYRGNSLTSSRDTYSTLPSLMETLDTAHAPLQHQPGLPASSNQVFQLQKMQPTINNIHRSSSDIYLASTSGNIQPLNNQKEKPLLNRINIESPSSPPPLTSVSSSSSNAARRNYSITRRHQSLDSSNKYVDAKIEQYESKIYSLCKDQHGCRFLQKTLEDKDPSHLELIFRETAPHMCELMTDPFGNYLCQKLLEHSTSPQRTELVRNSSPNLIAIALDPHGTRALQKMIEYAKDPDQVQIIIEALRGDVVRLIQDLNGNHVVQKCLNHLRAPDTQFIIDAVSDNCVVVATHKHGCCVLQRCIDHSSPQQKQQLINEIIAHSHELVQDPFGNYVAQYVLDLKEPEFSEPLIRTFIGHVCMLSQQKFSSNVMEKCLRFAGPETQRTLIDELIHSTDLGIMLRDPYANYVIQTALDYADDEMKKVVASCLIPILPSIKMTPYGRKIQTKLQQFAGCGMVPISGLPSPGLSAIASPTSPNANLYSHQQQQIGGSSVHQIQNMSQVHQAMAAASAAVSNMSLNGNRGQMSPPLPLPGHHSINSMNINGSINNLEAIPIASSSMISPSNGINQIQMNNMNTMDQMNQITQMINAMGVSQHQVNMMYNDDTKSETNNNHATNKGRAKNGRRNSRASTGGYKNGNFIGQDGNNENESHGFNNKSDSANNASMMDSRNYNNYPYSGNDSNYANEFNSRHYNGHDYRLKRNLSRNKSVDGYYKNTRYNNNNGGGASTVYNDNNNHNTNHNLYINTNVGSNRPLSPPNTQRYDSSRRSSFTNNNHNNIYEGQFYPA